MKRLLKIVVTIAALFYLGAVGYLYFGQDGMIFPVPDTDTANAGDETFNQITIDTPDGERLFALYHPAEDGEATVMIFHGNRSSAVRQKRRGKILSDAGFGVLALSYRGYPGSTGTPSEKGLFTDAEAGFDYLTRQKAQDIALYGHSLGSGVATYLASVRPAYAIVLEAPFDALVNVAAKRYPWVPVYPLTKHRFHSDRYIQTFNTPVFIMHGDNDPTVPIDHGLKLYEARPENTVFETFKGHGHSGFTDIGSEQKAIAFFKQTRIKQD